MSGHPRSEGWLRAQDTRNRAAEGTRGSHPGLNGLKTRLLEVERRSSLPATWLALGLAATGTYCCKANHPMQASSLSQKAPF